MQRRTLIRTAAAAPLLVSPAVRPAHAAAPDGVGDGAGVVWQRLFPVPANFPVLDGTPIRFPISLAGSARRSASSDATGRVTVLIRRWRAWRD